MYFDRCLECLLGHIVIRPGLANTVCRCVYMKQNTSRMRTRRSLSANVATYRSTTRAIAASLPRMGILNLTGIYVLCCD